MALFDNVERLLYEEYYGDVIDNDLLPVHEWRHFDRGDPFVELNEAEFWLHYRFSPESVEHLADVITPHLRVDNRRHSLTPLQMVLLTLSSLGGDEFQRTTARMVRCSQQTVSVAAARVINALVALKPRYVRLPTADEEHASAQEILRRFNFSLYPKLLLSMFTRSILPTSCLPQYPTP